jgi:hypothetical protein
MEVVREGFDRTPGWVREDVVAEKGTVEMFPFSMEAEAFRLLGGEPDIHKASVPDEEPALCL